MLNSYEWKEKVAEIGKHVPLVNVFTAIHHFGLVEVDPSLDVCEDHKPILKQGIKAFSKAVGDPANLHDSDRNDFLTHNENNPIETKVSADTFFRLSVLREGVIEEKAALPGTIEALTAGMAYHHLLSAFGAILLKDGMVNKELLCACCGVLGKINQLDCGVRVCQFCFDHFSSMVNVACPADPCSLKAGQELPSWSLHVQSLPDVSIQESISQLCKNYKPILWKPLSSQVAQQATE